MGLACGGGFGAGLMPSADLRAAPLSLSVIRDEAGLEEEFESFIQFSGTDGSWATCRELIGQLNGTSADGCISSVTQNPDNSSEYNREFT